MMILYLLQSIVPLVLIAWLALAPPGNTSGVWAQALAICAGLLAVGLTGIWAFPPWWILYAFAALLLAALPIASAKLRSRAFWPNAVFGWLSFAGFAAFGFYAANEARLALGAIRMPVGPNIALSSPLAPGVYLVANGGNARSVNAHMILLDPSIAQYRKYRGTAHGVDLIALDRWGFRADGIMPTEPQRYVIFGRSVIAPCAGEVIEAVDGLPDMPVPQVDHDHLAGNHVILRCLGADILLGHFRNGSVLVRPGQRLFVGAPIAQVGNSGNTSEPHLHVNAQASGKPDAPFAGAPIPIKINGRYLVRNDRLVVPAQSVQP